MFTTPHRMLLSIAMAALLSTDASAQILGTRETELILVKVTVSDLAKSLDFYTRIVGLKFAPAQPGQSQPDPNSKAAFIEIGLNFTGSRTDPFFMVQRQEGARPTAEAAKLTVVGLKVSDTRAVVERVRSAGYKVEREPFDYMGIVIAYVRDPDGYTVEFFQTPGTRRTGQ